MDTKGRVSIPATFRRVLEAGDPNWQPGANPELVIVYGDHRRNYLECYTMEAIEEVDSKIDAMPRGAIERKMLQRMFHGQSFPTNVDETGRLVLPAKLRSKIELEGEAFLSQQVTRFKYGSPRLMTPRSWPRPRLGWMTFPTISTPLPSLMAHRLPQGRGAECMVVGDISSQPQSHVPVLLRPLLKAVAPVSGVWLDGTFGAGGYTRGLLEAGAEQVIAVDRDPHVFELAKTWSADYGDRLVMQPGVFSRMDTYGEMLDGVVLDLGVSSMQLDQAERGFSFMKDGPLDMRMSQDGISAADLVNEASEGALADILFHYGEERASRRIARSIVRARTEAPITRTLQLADLIESCLPRPKPGQSHPATRSFQALRIAVNEEYDELFKGLIAAERALKPGGMLAVVSFHSVEDRMVKRFLAARAGQTGRANRYAPGS